MKKLILKFFDWIMHNFETIYREEKHSMTSEEKQEWIDQSREYNQKTKELRKQG
jgi:hypothetical protein